ERAELAFHLRDRAVEAGDLGVDLAGADLVMRDLEARRRHEVRVTDRDAAGDSRPLQGEARRGRGGFAGLQESYSSSPKRSAISRVSADAAASASSPSASTTTGLPLPAASIITPMMLFAFTRRPLRESQTSAAKPPATSVSRAAARACRPSLFTISASVRAI